MTLLEVIVALLIAGMAALLLYDATGSALQATQAAARYDQAIVRAKSRLAAATHGTKLTPGDWRGDDGGGFRWRLHVAPLATTLAPPNGSATPGTGLSTPLVLYAVTVWIGWSDGRTARDVRLDTEQVGG
jgi:hypothetical protein